MENRAFTLLVGVVYLALGICGMIPPLRGLSPYWTEPPPAVSLGYGFLFSIFAVNVVSVLVFVAIGVGGLVAAFKLRSSRVFERTLFTVSIIFAILGCMPAVSRGPMPLYGWTDGLFMMTALLSFYFAFVEGPYPALLNQPVRHH